MPCLTLSGLKASTDKTLEKINNVKYTFWFNDQTLFVANDFEIFLLDRTNNSQRLLTRISEPIRGILKTKTDNYLIYYTDQGLYVLTWDKGDETLQATKLIGLAGISSPILDDAEKIIYFFAKINNQAGLYKISLK